MTSTRQPTMPNRGPDLLDILREKDKQIQFLTSTLGQPHLLEQIKAKDEQILTLTRTIGTLTQTIEVQMTQQRHTAAKLNEVSNQYHRLQYEHGQCYSTQGEEAQDLYDGIIDELQTEVECLRDKLRVTQEDADQSKARAEDWEEQDKMTAEGLLAEIRRLRVMLDESIATTKGASDDGEGEHDHAGLQFARVAITALDGKVKLLEKKNKVQLAESTSLGDQIVVMDGGALDLRNEVSALNCQIALHDEEIEGFQKQFGFLTTQRKRWEDKASSLALDNEYLKYQLRPLKSENEVLRKEVSNLTGQLVPLEQEAEVMRKEVSDLSRQLVPLEQEAQVLRKEVSNLTGQLVPLEREAEVMRKEISDMTGQIVEHDCQEALAEESIEKVEKDEVVDEDGDDGVRSVASADDISEREVWDKDFEGNDTGGVDEGLQPAAGNDKTTGSERLKFGWFDWEGP